MKVGWLGGELVSTFTIDLHMKFDVPVSTCLLVLPSDRHLNTHFLLAAPLCPFNKYCQREDLRLLKAVLLSIQIFWHVTPCRWVRNSQRFEQS